MPALKIAIDLASLRQPFRKALAMAARMGAKGVELDARSDLRPSEITGTALRELRGLLTEHNLKVAAVGFQTRRGYDVPDEIERRVAATKAAMRLAADLRAEIVINQIGAVPTEPGGPEWLLLVQTLTDLGQFGHHIGARLAAQTGTESGADLARLLAALPPQSIAVDLDPGNLIMNNLSPLEAVQSLGSAIVHVHARDAVRDLTRRRGIEVPLGRGSADFPNLLGALEEHQFRGFFTIRRTEGDDPEYEVGQAVKYLQNL